MNILILAAGEDAIDGSFPVWLAELSDGELVIERQVSALSRIGATTFAFAVRASDVHTFNAGDIIEQVSPGATVIEIKRPTAGAACTALLMIGTVDPSDELIVASATDMIDIDYALVVKTFREKNADAGVLTFDSLHPRYSYVRVDEHDRVIEAAEKRPFSRHANAGFFWYRRAQDFFDSVQQMVIKDAHVNDIFYISPSLNELVLRNKMIVRYQISSKQYSPMKTEKQVEISSQKFGDLGEMKSSSASTRQELA